MENNEIVTKFKLKKKKQIVLLIVILIAIVILINIGEGSSELLGKISVGLVIICMILSYINWRCPSCNKYLGKGFNPGFCSKCGVSLQNKKSD